MSIEEIEPWKNLLRRAGFKPIDTESAARRVAAHAADEIEALVEALEGLVSMLKRSNAQVTQEVVDAEAVIKAVKEIK